MLDAGFNLNATPQPTTKRRVDMNGHDFYPTPKWATHALIEYEKFQGDIWECACGDGEMSNVLENIGTVYSSDLYDRGFGDSGIDFTTSERKASNIITNPPYNSAENFVHKGVELANKKFALLLRLAFLEGGNRQRTIFAQYPPSRIWVFSERITFYPKNVEKKGGGTTAYGWFIWDKDASSKTEVNWFPPGLKKQFS